MGELLYLVQKGRDWAVPQTAQTLLAAPNVTVHLSTVNVLNTALLYDGPLLCGLMCPLKG